MAHTPEPPTAPPASDAPAPPRESRCGRILCVDGTCIGLCGCMPAPPLAIYGNTLPPDAPAALHLTADEIVAMEHTATAQAIRVALPASPAQEARSLMESLRESVPLPPADRASFDALVATLPSRSPAQEATPPREWSGIWNNWIAPFHACPRCGASLNWKQGEDALERPLISASHCGVYFSAPMTWECEATAPTPEASPEPGGLEYAADHVASVFKLRAPAREASSAPGEDADVFVFTTDYLARFVAACAEQLDVAKGTAGTLRISAERLTELEATVAALTAERGAREQGQEG